MPSNAYDAKGLLLSSIFDPDPAIFLEHRWLHNSLGEVPHDDYRISLGKQIKSPKVRILLVSMSYMTVEALMHKNI